LQSIDHDEAVFMGCKAIRPVKKTGVFCCFLVKNGTSDYGLSFNHHICDCALA